MYSVGEVFTYEIEDNEESFTAVGDIIIKGKEYIIAEDEDNMKYVFRYDEEEEQIEIIDEEEADLYLEYWQQEYYGTSEEVDLWEEDYSDEMEYKEDDYYSEDDTYSDSEEDYDSYIDGLID